MRIQPFYALCLGLLAVTIACKEAKKEPPKQINNLNDLKDMAENISKDVSENSSRMAERRAKGDTMPIPYKELEAYLPEIPGYTKDGGTDGRMVNTPGLGAWSNTSQSYKNATDDISVEIMDYNGAYNGFAAATSVYKMNISSENDEEKTGSLNLGIPNTAAFEHIDKKNKDAELTVIVGDRFVVHMRGSNLGSSAPLIAIAKSMKLADLAAK
jgi:hypothetical protein